MAHISRSAFAQRQFVLVLAKEVHRYREALGDENRPALVEILGFLEIDGDGLGVDGGIPHPHHVGHTSVLAVLDSLGKVGCVHLISLAYVVKAYLGRAHIGLASSQVACAAELQILQGKVQRRSDVLRREHLHARLFLLLAAERVSPIGKLRERTLGIIHRQRRRSV